VAKLGLLQAVSHKLYRSHIHPWSSGVNLRKVEGSHHAQTSDSGRPGALPRGGGTERPKQFGQLGYARVDREGLRVAVVCENYPESQISKENFTDFRWAIGRHMDELPEDGFTHRLVDSYWAEGRLLWSATTKDQGLVGCQGTYPRGLCRLQAHVSGPGCSSHLQEGGGLFPGHAEDAERY